MTGDGGQDWNGQRTETGIAHEGGDDTRERARMPAQEARTSAAAEANRGAAEREMANGGSRPRRVVVSRCGAQIVEWWAARDDR